MATSLPTEHNFPAPEATRQALAPDLHNIPHEPKKVSKAAKTPSQLRLSDGETQAFRHLAHSMVSRTLAHESEYRRMNCPKLDNGDWKLLKRQDDLNIYKRRSPNNEQARARPPTRPMVLCVGSVPGTLEDVLYGVHAKTRGEMQATIPHVSRGYVDCAMLAKLDGASSIDPYRQLTLKWHLVGAVKDANLAYRRDLCVLESMGISTDAQGERYAYHLIKSVDFARCPPPPKESGIIRANIMLCCIYRQSLESQTVSMYAKGMFDLCGDVPYLINNASCSMMLSTVGAMASAEAKRLTLLALQKAERFASLSCTDDLSAVDLEEFGLEDFDLVVDPALSGSSSSGHSVLAEVTFTPPPRLLRWLTKAKHKSRSKRQQTADACCVCAKKPAMASLVGASRRPCGICLRSVCSKCHVKRRLVAKSQPVAITCCKSCLLEAKHLAVDPLDPCPMLPQ